MYIILYRHILCCKCFLAALHHVRPMQNCQVRGDSNDARFLSPNIWEYLSGSRCIISGRQGGARGTNITNGALGALHFQISDDGAAPRAAELQPECCQHVSHSVAKLRIFCAVLCIFWCIFLCIFQKFGDFEDLTLERSTSRLELDAMYDFSYFSQPHAA